MLLHTHSIQKTTNQKLEWFPSIEDALARSSTSSIYSSLQHANATQSSCTAPRSALTSSPSPILCSPKNSTNITIVDKMTKHQLPKLSTSQEPTISRTFQKVWCHHLQLCPKVGVTFKTLISICQTLTKFHQISVPSFPVTHAFDASVVPWAITNEQQSASWSLNRPEEEQRNHKQFICAWKSFIPSS
jgi:hypothetical protein